MDSVVLAAGPDRACAATGTIWHNILREAKKKETFLKNLLREYKKKQHVFLAQGCVVSPGFIFTSAEHARVKCVSVQMATSIWPMCVGVWHIVPLACYTQMSNALYGKCVLAGGKKGVMIMVMTRLWVSVCVCVIMWPMLHYLRHFHTRWASS